MKVKTKKKQQSIHAFYWDGSDEALQKINDWLKKHDFGPLYVGRAKPEKDELLIFRTRPGIRVNVPADNWVLCQQHHDATRIPMNYVWKESPEDFKKHYKRRKKKKKPDLSESLPSWGWYS